MGSAAHFTSAPSVNTSRISTGDSLLRAIIFYLQGFSFLGDNPSSQRLADQWGLKFGKKILIYLLKTLLLESNCPLFFEKIPSFEINHCPHLPRGSAFINSFSVLYPKILSWRGASQLDPYSCHRSFHLALNLNNRSSSIKWNRLAYSHRCLSILIITKNLRDIYLAGLVERVGVEPTRCYHRGILSFPVVCLWSISGAMVLINAPFWERNRV